MIEVKCPRCGCPGFKARQFTHEDAPEARHLVIYCPKCEAILVNVPLTFLEKGWQRLSQTQRRTNAVAWRKEAAHIQHR